LVNDTAVLRSYLCAGRVASVRQRAIQYASRGTRRKPRTDVGIATARSWSSPPPLTPTLSVVCNQQKCSPAVAVTCPSASWSTVVRRHILNLMKANSQFHVPAVLLPRRNPWYSLVGRWAGPRTCLHTIGKRKISLFFWKSNLDSSIYSVA
jgi:hypothetical protein